jgi:hypothetical protein
VDNISSFLKDHFFPIKVIVTGPSVVGAMKLQLGIMASCHRFEQQNGIDYTETTVGNYGLLSPL